MSPAGGIPPGSFLRPGGRTGGYCGAALAFGHDGMARAAHGYLFGRIRRGRPGPPVQPGDMVGLCGAAGTHARDCELAHVPVAGQHGRPGPTLRPCGSLTPCGHLRGRRAARAGEQNAQNRCEQNARNEQNEQNLILAGVSRMRKTRS